MGQCDTSVGTIMNLHKPRLSRGKGLPLKLQTTGMVGVYTPLNPLPVAPGLTARRWTVGFASRGEMGQCDTSVGTIMNLHKPRLSRGKGLPLKLLATGMLGVYTPLNPLPVAPGLTARRWTVGFASNTPS
ncbi:hypothetical protein FHS86_003668 [Roseimarinus sediminis]